MANDQPTSDLPDTKRVLEQLYGDGKPPLFVLLSVLIASTVSGLPKFLRQTMGRERLRIAQLGTMPVHEWVAIYSDSRRIKDAVGRSVFGEEFDATAASREWQQFIHQPKEAIREQVKAEISEDPNAFNELLLGLRGIPFPPGDDLLRELLGSFEDTGGKVEAESNADERSPFDVPELVFFLRVWFPCFVLHKTYPPMLMRKARRGCIDSFELLLRLDKSVIFDRVLSQRWHDIANGTDWKLRKRLLKAMNEPPRGKIDPKRVRLMLAGLISQLARALGCEVTSPEIGELFHRIERIRTGEVADKRIPAAESLLKSIQRNRNWPSFPRS